MADNIAKPIVNTEIPPSPPAEPPTLPKIPITPENHPSETPVEKLTDLPNEKKQVDPTTVDALIPSDPYYMDPLFYEVANYFGVKQEEYADAKYKLSDIVEYVIRDIKSNQPEDVLRGIRFLENRIQPPNWEEKRYTNLYRYIRLASKEQTLRQAMEAFEKGAKV